MTQKDIEHEIWMDLSQAAAYLGVHFTTLRRWADAGQIPYIRTPGRRRRFSRRILEAFVQHMIQPGVTDLTVQPALQPLHTRAVDNARQSVRNLPSQERWLDRMSEDQRLRLRGTGNRLMALLLQYNGRSDGGEAFIEEGKRITREYSQVCSGVGLSLSETVRVFLFFRRSILDAIHETGYLGGREDVEGLRLYQRTTDFLDNLLLDLIGSYLLIQDSVS